MREYLAALSEDPRLRTVLLETGDGTALSVRRQNIDRSGKLSESGAMDQADVSDSEE